MAYSLFSHNLGIKEERTGNRQEESFKELQKGGRLKVGEEGAD